MLKHIRDGIRRAGLKLSQVTFIPAPGHGVLLFNGHRLTCSCSPKDPHTASLRIARDLCKLKQGIDMRVQHGTLHGREAVRYDTAVYYKIAGHWYRAIGQEDQFIPN